MKIKHIKFCAVIGFGYWYDDYKSFLPGGFAHNIVLPFIRMQFGYLPNTLLYNKDGIIATCDGCVTELTEKEIAYTNDGGDDYCNDCYLAIQGDPESMAGIKED